MAYVVLGYSCFRYRFSSTYSKISTSSSKISSVRSYNSFEIIEDKLELVEISEFLRLCLPPSEAGTTQRSINCTFCPPLIEKYVMNRRYRNCAAADDECKVKYRIDSSVKANLGKISCRGNHIKHEILKHYNNVREWPVRKIQNWSK